MAIQLAAHGPNLACVKGFGESEEESESERERPLRLITKKCSGVGIWKWGNGCKERKAGASEYLLYLQYYLLAEHSV